MVAQPPPSIRRRPDSTLLFRIMNPELFYTVPKPILAVGVACCALACANTARLVLSAEPESARRRAADLDDAADDD